MPPSSPTAVSCSTRPAPSALSRSSTRRCAATPAAALAAFYAGEIERQVGSIAEAEAHLRRAIKLMSPDRRPIEALKALSTDRKR